MNLAILLEMAVAGMGERTAVGSLRGGISYAELFEQSRRAASFIHVSGIERVGLVDTNSSAVPIFLFGSAIAGVPFVPLNYRLSDERLASLIARTAPSIVVVEPPVVDRIAPIAGVRMMIRENAMTSLLSSAAYSRDWQGTSDDIAVLLFTSGTTGEPKSAVLRHRHLTSYVLSTVEFMSASVDEATLVSVPPYHIAGIAAVLSSVYAGRRLVQLASFDPERWVDMARDEHVTHAMVIPTMLGRILDVLEGSDSGLPSLRHLSYGGGRMPVATVERALELLPRVDFVNAYGLTETSSTIAVLGPEDHRQAWSSSEPAVRRRLGSVGHPLPTVELEVRDASGRPVSDGEPGEIWVRGEQIAGEYVESVDLGDEGWFCTRDLGYIDESGFLYVAGRTDDVIVRGGENISPGEVEDVLRLHPAVADVAVVGLPDPDWGEQVAAAVVLATGAHVSAEDLKAFVRQQLRSSRTPGRIEFLPALPYNEAGKVVRRALRESMTSVQ
jgi:acyl-CoA synthetase (AMP-forming)/AMP-acid ligase II